jgi:hypothetical protein
MAKAALFRDLVWHFFGRFFDKESLSPQGEPEAGVIQTLGMLTAPSGFILLLALVLNVQSWNLVTSFPLYLLLHDCDGCRDGIRMGRTIP